MSTQQVESPETANAEQDEDVQIVQKQQTENAAEDQSESKDEPVNEGETDSSEGDGEKQDPEEKEEKPKPSKAKKRIDELTRQRYEAQKQAKELESKLRETQEQLDRLKDQGVKKPNRDDYVDDEQYDAALIKYALDKKSLEEKRQGNQQSLKMAAEEAQARRQKAASDYSDKISSESSQYENFNEVVGSGAFTSIVNAMDPDLIELIHTSDKGVGLAYHLASNLEQADELAQMNPLRAAQQLAKIEAGLQKASPKKVTNAPTPQKPIGAKGKSSKTIYDSSMSIEEYAKARGYK